MSTKDVFNTLRLPRSYTLYAVEADIENMHFLYAWQSLGIKMLHPVSLFFLFFPRVEACWLFGRTSLLFLFSPRAG